MCTFLLWLLSHTEYFLQWQFPPQLFLMLKMKELMLQLSHHKNSIQTSVGSGKALVGVSEFPSQSGEVTEMS